MKIIDLSHTVHADILTFPGTEQPKFEQATTFEQHGFVENVVTMFTHTGTHLDAPYHILESGKKTDQFAVDKFIGKARVIDLANITTGVIGVDDLNKHGHLLGDLDFLVFNTGWSKYWGDNRYFADFPVLNRESAEWLLQFNLKGIGIDAISIDPVEDKNFSVHRVLFERDIIIIENMTNLDEVGGESFILSCLPLKFKDADGSPVRAVAMII
ncbi:MAG: cyclase family protein [Candidatus Brocadia sp.]|nr:cyclase family protein [Candidatus Brocadia sp.]MDG6025158.1 cyclase family protein [Candidatus Brocadia sp.]